MYQLTFMRKESRGVYIDHVENHESRALAEQRYETLLTDKTVLGLALVGVIRSLEYSPAESV